MKRKANHILDFFTRNQTLLLFLLVLLTAGCFRLTYLQFIEFKADESLNLFLASRPLFGHPFPPASLTSSIGILNFPLLNYFLFPMVLVSVYPPFVSFCIGLLNTLSIGWFFIISKKYFGTLTAFLTVLLFSFAPWAILYSRKIWAQDFIIPLVICLLFAFFKIYFEKQAKYYFLFILIGLFLLQIHQTTGILPILLFPFLLIKQKPNFKYAAFGLILGLLPTLPYAYYQLNLGCPDCSIVSVAKSHFVAFHPEMFLRPVEIVSTGNLHSIFGNTDYASFAQNQKLIYTIMKSSYLLYIILPLSMLYFWIKEQRLRIFPLVTLFILCVFFIARIDAQIHYVILLLPFLFLFLGFLLSNLLTNRILPIKLAGVFLAILFVGNSLLFDTTFFHLLSGKKGFGGDYGGSFAITEKRAQQEMAAYRKSRDYTEILLADYIPRELIEGSMPLGQMIYPYNTIQKDIPLLTQYMLGLKNKTPDPRKFNELWAFYTYPQNVTPSTFATLRKLSKTSPVFSSILNASYANYLARIYRHSYSNIDLLFEYPSYWILTSHDSPVTVEDEKVALKFIWGEKPPLFPSFSCTSQSIIIAGYATNKHVCNDKENQWTETFIDPIVIRKTFYTVEMTPLSSKLSIQEVQHYQSVFDEIISSFISL